MSAELRRWAVNILTWPFIYGMALAGYRYFREHNPDELAMESKASAIYEWLQYWRRDEGSYYRNGYGNLKLGILDTGNSDDCCHTGRGLIGYYAITGRQDALSDADWLSTYHSSPPIPEPAIERKELGSSGRQTKYHHSDYYTI